MAPFGREGVRVLMADGESHYGLNNVVLDAGSGKWVIVYRKGDEHGVALGSELRAVDTYDEGRTHINDRMIYTQSTSDTRNFTAGMMGGARLGILVTRRTDSVAGYSSSVFFHSDDAGVTWQAVYIAKEATDQRVNFHGHLLAYPASVGGHDTLGWIAYSHGSADGAIDALRTNDNGATWTWARVVASPSSPISHGEPTVVRLGTSDRWLMICRNNAATDAAAYTSTDMLSWSSQQASGIALKNNPPAAIWDDGRVWLYAFSRGGREILSGYDHHLLATSADDDALFAANGNFGAIGCKWSVELPVPAFATGYAIPQKIGGKWVASFCAGERRPGTTTSELFLYGDFDTSPADTALYMDRVHAGGEYAGTFEPTVVGATVAGICTYTPGKRSGTFYRVGRAYHFSLVVGWSGHTGEGGIRITGLPFEAPPVGVQPVSVMFSSLSHTGEQVIAAVAGGSSDVALYTQSSDASSTLLQMDPSGSLWITGVVRMADDVA
jgi:hypothetical protein